MENIIINLGEKQLATIRTVDCTNANRTNIVIENAAGCEMLKLSFKNDGSEYSICEKGVPKFIKTIK